MSLPADFDPFFAVMGVKKRDWTKPPVKAATTRGGSAC